MSAPTRNLLGCLADALDLPWMHVYTDATAARKTPCCVITQDGTSEKELPMGRTERESRFTIRYYPKPNTEVLSWAVGPDPSHASGAVLEGVRVWGDVEAVVQLVRVIDTPDGLVRGRNVKTSFKDGAFVISVGYTEFLREVETRDAMETLELRHDLVLG